jgi:uncharacterized membrane protein YeaQ/YmgE (transglycosylase-associated protein family)
MVASGHFTRRDDPAAKQRLRARGRPPPGAVTPKTRRRVECCNPPAANYLDGPRNPGHVISLLDDPNTCGVHMSILGWLVLGLIAGFIASKIVNHTGSGVLMDIVLGIVGAMVGGWLFTTFGAMPVTGFNIYSMLVAVVGAVVVLFIYHALVGRRAIT